MKTIVVGQKERVGKWVASRVKRSSGWHDYEALGVEQNGALVGGVVIDDYVLHTRCSIHCAGEGKRWLNREFLFVVFDYAFRQLDCRVIVQTVSSANTDSIKFTSHLGFEEKCRITGGSTDGDLVILSMNRDDCKWLKLVVR